MVPVNQFALWVAELGCVTPGQSEPTGQIDLGGDKLLFRENIGQHCSSYIDKKLALLMMV